METDAPKTIKRFVQDDWKLEEKSIKVKAKIVDNAPFREMDMVVESLCAKMLRRYLDYAIVSTKKEDMPKARETMTKEVFFGLLSRELSQERPASSTIDLTKKKKDKRKERNKVVLIRDKE